MANHKKGDNILESSEKIFINLSPYFFLRTVDHVAKIRSGLTIIVLEIKKLHKLIAQKSDPN